MSKFMRFSTEVKTVFNNDVNDFMAFSELLTDVARGTQKVTKEEANKKIVDVFKEYMNSDGKIITSIFEVANQASLLGGEYDGYRVLYTQKVNEG